MGADPFRVYLSVVVKGVDAYIDGINARLNGRLVIHRIYRYADGSTDTFLMAHAPIDTVETSQGGRSGTTGVLSGFENMAPVNAQTIELFDPVPRGS